MEIKNFILLGDTMEIANPIFKIINVSGEVI